MVLPSLKEAVTHHALAKEEKQDYQDNHEKQSCNSQPR